MEKERHHSSRYRKREYTETVDDGANAATIGGVLETAKADRAVWLMKCPLVVAKSWQAHAAASDSQPVAKVVVSLDPLQPDEPPQWLDSGKYFRVQSSEFGVGGKAAVEGKVDHKFDLKPHNENIEEYGRLCRERTNKSMIRTRQVQVIDDNRGMHMRPMPGMVGLMSSNSKQEKKKPQPVKQTEVKRTRRDRGELEDIMFKLFEKQPNWALKQLVQETDQPAQFLKEILNELCVYNKRGSNQGTYELKPEYKKTAVPEPGAE
ncbi:unnamed protein product [Linum tenue]|uniref:TFIIF beta subunit HTH domain-containing protein n=1 Tax=Linum tenue TaxID=586396 RepID=A0AAV0LN43_9ROSI|nr:unnamed protein product [Linum tenue]